MPAKVTITLTYHGKVRSKLERETTGNQQAGKPVMHTSTQQSVRRSRYKQVKQYTVAKVTGTQEQSPGDTLEQSQVDTLLRKPNYTVHFVPSDKIKRTS